MNESYVSTKLRKAVEDLGAGCWKCSDRFHASRPDLAFFFRAECSFVEMKMGNNEPTPLQSDTLNYLSAVGIQTYVGQYYKDTKTLVIRDWITEESNSFKDIKDAAKWLLKLPS